MNDLNNNPDPTFDDKPTSFGPLLGILSVVVLGAILYSVFAGDDEVVRVDLNDPVEIDRDIRVDTNPVFVRDLESADDFRVVLGSRVNSQDVFVTEVISDRIFRVSETDNAGKGILMYLDDSLDLGAAEGRVDVEVGDTVMVSGEFTDDLSDQTLEADDSNTINVDGAVLLVTDIEFIDEEDLDN